MSISYAWFGAVLGYVVQTKCLSIIQSKLLVRSLAKMSYQNSKNPPSREETSYILTIYLTFIYCVSFLFVLPLSQFICDRISAIRMESTISSTSSSNDDIETAFGSHSIDDVDRCNDDNNDNNNNNTDSTTTNNNSAMDIEDSAFEMNLLNDASMPPPRNIVIAHNMTRRTDHNTVTYLGKLIVLAFCLIVPIFTYNYALSLSPAFDVSLIQNTAVFEIVSLLLGVCNISRKQSLFKNFLVMMSALIGILIVSYTKATCDLLSGKLSINKHTGEVADPFLFDRLKAGLICGLGSLLLGPFAVLWHRWFGLTNTHSLMGKPCIEKYLFRQSTHVSLIGTICIFMLLPFIPNLANSFQIISYLYMDKFFWVTIMGSILFGTLPNLFSIIILTNEYSPEFITTCNLGAIVFMGLADWITEPGQTTVIQWEVIGYMVLASSCIYLSISLK
ncbi:similar to Saccharomyces cerevisiae YBR036C CSG2 Endoplasmic reticulum membrane protein, required for mannosylation of inositolphosphorylceramide and for growth at high calcium concentrations [Maudiozyma barnettii]|nr:similar to Saccharomyces cerevisiae YBR036C CSG2 Endoplasmic reticulum membrane protein, required for mannosylation of inositolphosphorylceramide and for growth at high calcium concentrations [Kazachstania barnettii]